jgi:23S rRNA pseudouridine955/2504/2580 synthase
MIAKRSRHLRQLHEALQNNRVEKWYLALVDGSWLEGARLINSKIRKNLLRGGERVVDVSAHGKESLTWMMPQERFREATLMKVRPLTGRTHQIRVHAAHSGHPVAGDEKYGHPDFNEKMHTLGLRRLFLHASELHLRLPGSGRVIHVEAPLPGPLLGVVARLRAEQVDQGQRLGVR